MRNILFQISLTLQLLKNHGILGDCDYGVVGGKTNPLKKSKYEKKE